MHLQPRLCISDNTHHTMIGTFPLYASVFSNVQIVTILILDCASLFFASPSRPTRDDALGHARSQYESSDTYNAVKEQFSLPHKRYSISQFTEFLLSHRLR